MLDSLAGAGLPLITDPAFYAVAVPAVLLMGLSKSGFLSGFGSLAVPLMALTTPVPQAAAIMLPLLLVMDATGLQQLWRQWDAALLRLLVPDGTDMDELAARYEVFVERLLMDGLRHR